VARVDSYERATQTVTVTPLVSDVTSEAGEARTYRTLPAVAGVPVCFPRGGGVALTWDLSIGDRVLLVVRDRSHDEVDDLAVTEQAQPEARRRFNLSDAVALPGYSPPADPLASSSYAAGHVVLTLPVAAELRVGDSTASQALALAAEAATRIKRLEDTVNSLVLPVAGATAGPPSPLRFGPASVPLQPFTNTSDVASGRVKTDG